MEIGKLCYFFAFSCHIFFSLFPHEFMTRPFLSSFFTLGLSCAFSFCDFVHMVCPPDFERLKGVVV